MSSLWPAGSTGRARPLRSHGLRAVPPQAEERRMARGGEIGDVVLDGLCHRLEAGGLSVQPRGRGFETRPFGVRQRVWADVTERGSRTRVARPRPHGLRARVLRLARPARRAVARDGSARARRHRPRRRGPRPSGDRLDAARPRGQPGVGDGLPRPSGAAAGGGGHPARASLGAGERRGGGRRGRARRNADRSRPRVAGAAARCSTCFGPARRRASRIGTPAS